MYNLYFASEPLLSVQFIHTDHHDYPFSELFSFSPNWTSVLIKQKLPYLPPLAPANQHSLFYLYEFDWSTNLTKEESERICVDMCDWLYLTSHNVLKIHPCWFQKSLPFGWLNNIPLCYLQHFPSFHPLVDRWPFRLLLHSLWVDHFFVCLKYFLIKILNGKVVEK